MDGCLIMFETRLVEVLKRVSKAGQGGSKLGGRREYQFTRGNTVI